MKPYVNEIGQEINIGDFVVATTNCTHRTNTLFGKFEGLSKNGNVRIRLDERHFDPKLRVKFGRRWGDRKVVTLKKNMVYKLFV